tara:strand:- start:7322 stop:7537 length:216 start_codon:yes stop_codon:yes gene_type:complete
MFIYLSVFTHISNTEIFINNSELQKNMTGKDKKMNHPEIYLIRVDKKLKRKLKKIGSKKVREYLNKYKKLN